MAKRLVLAGRFYRFAASTVRYRVIIRSIGIQVCLPGHRIETEENDREAGGHGNVRYGRVRTLARDEPSRARPVVVRLQRRRGLRAPVPVYRVLRRGQENGHEGSAREGW